MVQDGSCFLSYPSEHITKQVTIEWSETVHYFLHLLVSRMLDNKILCGFLGVEKEYVLQDKEQQEKAFYSIFPREG